MKHFYQPRIQLRATYHYCSSIVSSRRPQIHSTDCSLPLKIRPISI